MTQAAISQQIQRLEEILGHQLFKRAWTGLILTDVGAALHPVLTRSLDQMAEALARFQSGRYREVLHLDVVTTFATGWLIPRLTDFEAAHPDVSLASSPTTTASRSPRRDCTWPCALATARPGPGSRLIR